ncbi:hypothetical protein ACFL52_01375 [Candidatus Margulisiibacteriota bacterium]
MDFSNIPFSKLTQNDSARPWLQIQIINPENNRRLKVLGLIDTGADECALPARYAPLLGHNLEKGVVKDINTGNGKTIAYSHTVKIVFKDQLIGETLVDFLPNLHIPLLGVKSFLNNFRLTVDYPEQLFSLAK